jgi:hypothetical protein
MLAVVQEKSVSDKHSDKRPVRDCETQHRQTKLDTLSLSPKTKKPNAISRGTVDGRARRRVAYTPKRGRDLLNVVSLADRGPSYLARHAM